MRNVGAKLQAFALMIEASISSDRVSFRSFTQLSNRSNSSACRCLHTARTLNVAELKVSFPTDLLWALIGLILTIGGTFLEAFITSAPWHWGQQGLQAQSLGVTYQIGAVLLTGCLGGRNAAVMSQVAYLLLGLTFFDVFSEGGGIDYIYRPSFGYLLGFIPGAWLCGWLAFRMPPRLESLAFSCLVGLLTVHATGIAYLLISDEILNLVDTANMPLSEMLMTYSVAPFPGQLAVICAVTVLAFLLRHLMFY